MWLLEQADAVAALPEILLAVLSLVLLMYGVFRKGDASDGVTIGALIALGLAALLVIGGGEGRRIVDPITGHRYATPLGFEFIDQG